MGTRFDLDTQRRCLLAREADSVGHSSEVKHESRLRASDVVNKEAAHIAENKQAPCCCADQVPRTAIYPTTPQVQLHSHVQRGGGASGCLGAARVKKCRDLESSAGAPGEWRPLQLDGDSSAIKLRRKRSLAAMRGSGFDKLTKASRFRSCPVHCWGLTAVRPRSTP